MKQPNFLSHFQSGLQPADKNRLAFQGGSYSLMVTAVVLAILILVNVLVSALPASLTRYDISASKLYSITSNTKVVVSALEEDVTIYWIVQSGEEDDVIETLLNKYDYRFDGSPAQDADDRRVPARLSGRRDLCDREKEAEPECSGLNG